MRNLQGLQYQHLVSWNLIPQRLAKFKLEHIHCAFIIQQNVSRSSGGPFASSFSVNGGEGSLPPFKLSNTIWHGPQATASFEFSVSTLSWQSQIPTVLGQRLWPHSESHTFTDCLPHTNSYQFSKQHTAPGRDQNWKVEDLVFHPCCHYFLSKRITL